MKIAEHFVVGRRIVRIVMAKYPLKISDKFDCRSKSASGFTLVELLVVIAIISILATLLLLQLGIARAKARDAKRIADVHQVRSAIELYFDDHGSFPGTAAPSTAPIMSFLAPLYLVSLPHDPLLPGCTDSYNGALSAGYNCYGYAWFPLANPTRYQIWAELERHAQVLDQDNDINSTGWNGAEARGEDDHDCTNDEPYDCIYDLGQNN